MNDNKMLSVFMDKRKVGTLAVTKDKLTAFEYDADWLRNGFRSARSLCRFSPGFLLPKVDPFEGTFGVFGRQPPGWLGSCWWTGCCEKKV